MGTRNLILFLALGGTIAEPWAQSKRYLDDVFQNVTVTSDIPYGTARNQGGDTKTLLLDIYQPQGDTAKSRPLLIFVHGGGFSAGSKTDGDIVFLCRTFARKGYVTASFSYRLGSGLNTVALMANATYRAVQDGKAAVRFLRAQSAGYRIDATRIIMGGTSAGGVLSLLAGYLDQAEVAATVDVAALGGLEASGGTPGVSSEIHGVVNCWGGVGDSTILYNGKAPALSFHGTADRTVPYDIGYALGNPALVMYGSACVHRNLTRAGVKSTLKLFTGMGHGMGSWDPRVDTLVTMTRDFAYEVLITSKPAAIQPTRRPSRTFISTLGSALSFGRFLADGRKVP